MCLATVGASHAQAPAGEAFAGRNITVLIGYAAGGTYDATARLLTRHMGRIFQATQT